MFLAHGWTWIFSLNTNRSNVTNIFGTRMDTDSFFEHESLESHECFWHTDEHRFFLNTNRSNITLSFLGTRMDTDLPCGWNNPMVRMEKICEIREIRVL